MENKFSVLEKVALEMPFNICVYEVQQSVSANPVCIM